MKRALTGALGALLVSCATAPDTSSRMLATDVGDLSALLEGCTAAGDDSEAQRLSCPGGIEVAVRPHAQGREARYRDDAAQRAQSLGASLTWDDTTVPTEAPSGRVERARATLPMNETPSFTLLGALHTVEGESDAMGGRAAEELWCIAADAAGEERCGQLLGALLGRRMPVVLRAPAPKPTSQPVTLLGRALSLPTACAVEAPTSRAGVARCDDLTLTWSVHASMEEASQALRAHLDALGDSADGDPYACRVMGEPAQCEVRTHARAGLTYLDGEALMVSCSAEGHVPPDDACRALLTPQRD